MKIRRIALLLAALFCVQGMVLIAGGAGAEGAQTPDLFYQADAPTLETLWKTGTGIVLLGGEGEAWTQALAALLGEVCAENGVGLVYRAAPETCEATGIAEEIRAYISRHGTSFANVYGSQAHIEALTKEDAPLEGLAIFLNKGTLIGVHAGTTAQAQTPADVPDEVQRQEAKEAIAGLIARLGSSPCPSYC